MLTPPSCAPCSRLELALMIAAPSALFWRTQNPLVLSCKRREILAQHVGFEALGALVQYAEIGL